MFIGQIVQYRLTSNDAQTINSRRKNARLVEIGTIGTPVKEGDVVPLVVTAIHDAGLVNGQLLLDGNDSYWVMNAGKLQEGGDSVGCWALPPLDEVMMGVLDEAMVRLKQVMEEVDEATEKRLNETLERTMKEAAALLAPLAPVAAAPVSESTEPPVVTETPAPVPNAG